MEDSLRSSQYGSTRNYANSIVQVLQLIGSIRSLLAISPSMPLKHLTAT